jgi:multidrug resistance efflux pump
MQIRSWRGTSTVGPSSPKRGFPWARVLLLLAILGLAGYIILPGYFYVSADALVKGDLVPVAPLYRVRIDRLYVQCADYVHAGESVARVSNFLVQAGYQRQYLQSIADMQLSRIALYEQVISAKENAANLHQKYLSAATDAERLGETYASYNQAYKQGAIAEVDWAAKRNEWLASTALARSEYAAWQRAEQEVERIGDAQTAKITADRQLSAQAQDLAEETGSTTLRAPVSGYVVDCVDRPQNVIEPSSPIFEIFEPDRAYVLAYFNPGSLSNIHLNQRVQLKIAGVQGTLTGRVGPIYPSLTKLPSELTRFFWQHVQWSEYRPVKIYLDDVSPREREQLYYDAQARVSVSLRGHGSK